MFNFLPVLPTISGFRLSENAANDVCISQPLPGPNRYCSVGIKRRGEGIFLKGPQTPWYSSCQYCSTDDSWDILGNILGSSSFTLIELRAASSASSFFSAVLACYWLHEQLMWIRSPWFEASRDCMAAGVIAQKNGANTSLFDTVPHAGRDMAILDLRKDIIYFT